MKMIPSLLCAVALAAMPLASQAGGQVGGLRASLGVGLMGAGFFMGPRDDRGRDHRDGQGHGYAPNPGYAQGRGGPPNPNNGGRGYPHDPRDYGGGPPPPAYNRDAGIYGHRPVVIGGGAGPGMPRDNRIDRAFAIGRGYGRVVNAWPQGGSLYLVRVNTPHGRVDMVIDVDTGRVVGER